MTNPLATFLLAALLCLGPSSALKPNSPYYTTKVGDFTITVVSDGTNTNFPLDQIASEVPAGALEIIKRDNGLFRPYIIHFNPVHIDTGRHKVIIDPGSSDKFGEGVGKLLENMEKAGLDPMEVDRVFVTHAHTDHIPGVRKPNGSKAFPNAKYYVGRVEYDFWKNVTVEDERLDLYKVEESMKRNIIDVAQSSLEFIEKNMVKFEFGDELVPGIKARALPGHTLGHSGFIIRSQNETAAILGDSIIVEIMQVEHPEWPIPFDMIPKKAMETRFALLEEFANTGTRVFLFHGNFPGIGRILKGPGGFEFRKADYEL